MNLLASIAWFSRLMGRHHSSDVQPRVPQRQVAAGAPEAACIGRCAHVHIRVWDALEATYPEQALEGPRHRQALAALFAPLMARGGWRFCRCYLGARPEHRFIQRLVDTEFANNEADCYEAINEEAEAHYAKFDAIAGGA